MMGTKQAQGLGWRVVPGSLQMLWWWRPRKIPGGWADLGGPGVVQVPDLAACTAYMCGPDAFMEAVGAALQQLHFPSSRLHQESFAF